MSTHVISMTKSAREQDNVPMTCKAAIDDDPEAAATTNWSSSMCDCCNDCTSCCAVTFCWPITFAQLWTAIKRRAGDQQKTCVIIAVVICVLYMAFSLGPQVIYPMNSESVGLTIKSTAASTYGYLGCVRAAGGSAAKTHACGSDFVEGLSGNLKGHGQTLTACVEDAVSPRVENPIETLYSTTSIRSYGSPEADVRACTGTFFKALSLDAVYGALLSPGIITLYSFQILCGIVFLVALCKLRGALRKRDRIAGSACEDCCSSFWCGSCTMCQMMRHEGMANGKYSLCSPTGNHVVPAVTAAAAASVDGMVVAQAVAVPVMPVVAEPAAKVVFTA